MFETGKSSELEMYADMFLNEFRYLKSASKTPENKERRADGIMASEG